MTDKNLLTEKVRPHVEALKLSAAAGNKKARQVIYLYHMHVACPSDPGAPALCSAALDDWLSDHTKLERAKGIEPST